MRTILVANRKGGCGKTMAAITLAAALAGGAAGWRWPTPTRRSRRSRWLKQPPGGRAGDTGLDWTKTATSARSPSSYDWLVIDAPGRDQRRPGRGADRRGGRR